MDVKNVTADEIRGYEPAKRQEFLSETRSELVGLRMDIYQSPATNLKAVKLMKKNIARALTVQSEQRKAEKQKKGAK